MYILILICKEGAAMPKKQSSNRIRSSLLKPIGNIRLKPLNNKNQLEQKAKKLLASETVPQSKLKPAQDLRPQKINREVHVPSFATKQEYRDEEKTYNDWKGRRIAECEAKIKEYKTYKAHDEKEHADIQIILAAAYEERAYWCSTAADYKTAIDYYEQSRLAYHNVSSTFFNTHHIAQKLTDNKDMLQEVKSKMKLKKE